MRTLALVVGSLAVAAAEPECIIPDGVMSAPAAWAIEDSVTEDKTHCFARAEDDHETYGSCNTRCTGLSGAGVTNGKIGCMDTAEKINKVHTLVEGGWPESYRFIWSGLRKSTVTPFEWADASCPNAVATWGVGLPAGTQAEWASVANDEGNPVGTTTDSSIWVMGEGPAPVPPGSDYGVAPYLADVTGASPNPADVFCICEWDVYVVYTCADNPAGYGCCDGDDTTALKTDTWGSNCVGGLWYTNDDAAKKAGAAVVAAAVGMATGILVAVIVVPILVVVLIIVCIVCLCCKKNKSPSA